jgi:hypothetical protein
VENEVSDILKAAIYEMPDGSHQVELTHPEPSRRLTAEQLSEYIDGLAVLRQKLAPAHLMQFVPIENMQNVADAPPWRTFYDEINDRTGLVIRHPGYGWVGYSMGMDQLDELIPALEKVRAYRNQQRKTPE